MTRRLLLGRALALCPLALCPLALALCSAASAREAGAVENVLRPKTKLVAHQQAETIAPALHAAQVDAPVAAQVEEEFAPELAEPPTEGDLEAEEPALPEETNEPEEPQELEGDSAYQDDSESEHYGAYPGEIVYDDSAVGGDFCSDCVGCGDASCGGCEACSSCDCYLCTMSNSQIWLRGEYLLWWMDGMYVPPLVTRTNAGAPVLGDPNTEILFGDEEVLEDPRSGWRVRLGQWFEDACGDTRWGWDGEYFGFAQEELQFVAASDAGGNPILGRPFFNINPRDILGNFDPPAREFAEFVSIPGELAGSVRVDIDSRLHSAAAHLRYSLWSNCSFDNSSCWALRRGPRRSRAAFLVGYRYMSLDEGLTITEDLDTINPPPPVNTENFFITDDFQTRNTFHGIELGVLGEAQHGRCSVEVLGKLAVGEVDQRVSINGQTTRSINGVPLQEVGGLLALPSNIGRYRRDEFAVIPQVDVTLGLQLARGLRLTGGYTFLYWSRVVRPGDQIDLDVNPDQLPFRGPGVPFAGAARPRFEFEDVDFWAHGLNFGAEFRW